jgi:hypothetical protein
MSNIDVMNKREVEELIKIRETIMRSDFYKELEKLRSQIIDLNDIKKVLERK